MAYQQQQQQQQQGTQDSRNPNRLHLNFGFNNPPNFAAEQGRAYPTTPSTFPQPFPNGAGQQEVWGTQQATSGINNAGYFYNNPGSMMQHGTPGEVTAPVFPYRGPSAPGDATNGLTAQFQHQNLGGGIPRSSSPFARQGSPAIPRPRTGGAAGQQYGSHLGAQPMPQQPHVPSIFDDEPPAKNPDKYSTVVTERVKLQKLLTHAFFKENVERARARNER